MGGCLHFVVAAVVSDGAASLCAVVGRSGCSLCLAGCVAHGCFRHCCSHLDLRSLGCCGCRCWIGLRCFAMGIAAAVEEVEVCWGGGVC